MRTLVLAAVLAAFSLPVHAEQNRCVPRQVAVDSFERLNADVVAAGLSAGGNLMEVYATDEGRWVATLTTADGKTCIVTNGTNWRQYMAIFPGGAQT